MGRSVSISWVRGALLFGGYSIALLACSMESGSEGWTTGLEEAPEDPSVVDSPAVELTAAQPDPGDDGNPDVPARDGKIVPSSLTATLGPQFGGSLNPPPSGTCTWMSIESELRPSFRVTDADVIFQGRDLYVVLVGIDGMATYRYDEIRRAFVGGTVVRKTQTGNLNRVAIGREFFAFTNFTSRYHMNFLVPGSTTRPWMSSPTWTDLGSSGTALSLGAFQSFPELTAAGSLAVLTGQNAGGTQPAKLVERLGSGPVDLGRIQWWADRNYPIRVAMSEDWFFMANAGWVDMVSIADLRSSVSSSSQPPFQAVTTTPLSGLLDMDTFGPAGLALLEESPRGRFLRVIKADPTRVGPAIAEIDVTALDVHRVAVAADAVVMVSREDDDVNGDPGGRGVVYVAQGCW